MKFKHVLVTSHTPPQGSVDITFCGDLYYGEFYKDYAKKRGLTHALDIHGYKGCGQAFKEFLGSSSLIIANLETALTNRPQPTHLQSKKYSFKGSPPENIAAIKKLPIHAVSLANNHTMDFGTEGLQDTLDSLHDGNIKTFGGGKNIAEARKPLLKDITVGAHIFKLAVISCFELIDVYATHLKFYAGENTTGVNGVDLKFLRDQITELKSQGYYVIIQPHWEGNFVYPTYLRTRIAHTLTDTCRADLVLGHGAHFFSDIHRAENGWIIFSLGDFIFNSWGEYKRYRIPSYSAIARLVLTSTQEGVKKFLHLYPIQSENTLTEFQPRFVNETEFEHFCLALFFKQNNPAFIQSSLTCHTDGKRYFLRLDLEQDFRQFI